MSQCGGGAHGAGCDIAHLYITLATDYARATSQSYAYLFVDLKYAFAGVCRQVAIDAPTDEVAWGHTLLTTAGFQREEADQITIAVPILREWQGVSQDHRRLLRSLLRNTWSATDFDGGVVAHKTGVLAGTPYRRCYVYDQEFVCFPTNTRPAYMRRHNHRPYPPTWLRQRLYQRRPCQRP